MTRAILFLTLPLFALGEWRQEDASAVAVYAQFDHPYSEPSVNRMKQELELIMGPIGVGFTWRDLNAVRGNEVSAELVVVHFVGTCAPDGPLDSRGRSKALGWTHVTDGSILPFSGLDCDRIRAFIASQVRGFDRAHRELAYGRAIGRVLAHELYHIFTESAAHASRGVAKAFYTPRELVSDTFQFREKDAAALRGGKLKPLLRDRMPPAASSAASR